MLTAGVILEKMNVGADKAYDYAVLPSDEDRAKVGVRVVVPFGRGNRSKSGMIVSLERKETDIRLKTIAEYSDSDPLLTPELTGLAEYISSKCFCSRYEAVRTMLPTATRIKKAEMCTAVRTDNIPSEFEDEYRQMLELGSLERDDYKKTFGKKAVSMIERGLVRVSYDTSPVCSDAFVKAVSLAVSREDAQSYLESAGRLRAKHEKVIDILEGIEQVPLNEICYLADVGRSVISTLEKRGIVTVDDIEVYRNPYGKKKYDDGGETVLSEQQQEAYDGLEKLYDDKAAHCALLHGVTGSGKTLVYMKLIEHAVSRGDKVILLVPEISLTPQLTDRVIAAFGERVAVLHSGMSVGERYDQWKRAGNGMADIVIGTRSAVFAPFEKVGLIILDEEQEGTYKSDITPRYHARDMAKYRAAYNHGLLVLGSATPSVESYANAKSGKYSLFELNDRYGGAKLPEVVISDMTKSLKNGNASVFGDELTQAIRETLDRKEQIILFHNRRGYNTFIGCGSCGYVFTCPDCSISMTYHHANGKLMCHYCGHTEDLPEACPSCGGGNIRYLGCGTQKIDEELKRLFCDARVVRMDLDTTNYKMAHERILGDFAAGKYDILVGTQMVTKGLDMENVTLVGILSADLMLFSDDFRCAEHAFSMMTQVVGRAGRASKSGRAIIQTYNPENRILGLASRQDYKGFFEGEKEFRRMMTYPPYCDMCQFVLSGTEQEKVKQGADALCSQLKKTFEEHKIKNVIMYPPLPSALLKIGGKYRYRIILKCRDNRELRERLRAVVGEFQRGNSSVTLVTDMNPQMII